MDIHTIVLAAGEGSRMKSNRAKSLQRIGGSSMLEKICFTAGKISPKLTLVVGFDKDSVIEESKKYNLEISLANQPKPIGTGDAVRCGLSSVEDGSKVLVLYGDVPLPVPYRVPGGAVQLAFLHAAIEEQRPDCSNAGDWRHLVHVADFGKWARNSCGFLASRSRPL